MAIQGVIDQPRASGGRFGAKAADPARPSMPATATAKIAAAEERERQNQLLVEPPHDMAVLNTFRFNRASPYATHTETMRTAIQLEDDLRAWFKATADHPGAMSRDLVRAWGRWRPVITSRKSTLRWNFVEDLFQVLKRRDGEVYRQAEREQAPARRRSALASARGRNAARFAEAQEAYDKAKAEYERTEAFIDGELARAVEEAREVAA